MLTGLNGSIWISFLHTFKTCYFVLSSILSSKWALDALVVYACMAQDKKMKNKTILLVNLKVQEHTSLSFD